MMKKGPSFRVRLMTKSEDENLDSRIMGSSRKRCSGPIPRKLAALTSRDTNVENMRGTTGDVSPGERRAKGCPFECKSGRHIYISALDIGGVGMNFARGNISSKLLLIVEPNLCGALRDGTWIDIENFKKLTILAKRLR